MPDDASSFTSLSGRVLAAAPELLDPNFHQSLIWVAEHSEDEALGFILNRPIDKTLGEVAGGPGLTDALRQIPLGFGGPVRPDQLALVLFQGGPAGWHCTWGLPPEKLETHLADPQCRVRAFLGYAGWGEGQLDRELREGAWRVLEPDPAMLDPTWARGLWSLLVAGDQRWKILRSYLPRDAQSN